MSDNIEPSAPSIAINTLGWINPAMKRFQQRAGRWAKHLASNRKLSRKSIHDLLPPVAILAGGLACSIWLNSLAAGLLACVLLFLLASIGRSLERITTLLLSQPFASFGLGSRSSRTEASSEPNIFISAKAMERLRPWVEDEASLTEESAKAYCSVLLDTLALLHPRLAGKTRAGNWS